ncbi:Argonaute linker 2 domain [Sesbania bispinosa]|nr:Argonaute linker 2 domain [Sesbania bispinosa]
MNGVDRGQRRRRTLKERFRFAGMRGYGSVGIGIESGGGVGGGASISGITVRGGRRRHCGDADEGVWMHVEPRAATMFPGDSNATVMKGAAVNGGGSTVVGVGRALANGACGGAVPATVIGGFDGYCRIFSMLFPCLCGCDYGTDGGRFGYDCRWFEEIVREHNFNIDKYVREFGINVREDLALVDARVLPPPTLKYYESGRESKVDPRMGQWNMIDKVTL